MKLLRPRTLMTACIAVLFCLARSSASGSDTVSTSPQQRAALAIHALQSWYDEQTGLYRTTGWWNSANAITTLADYSKATGSREFDPVFANTFTAAQKTFSGFLNRFYDDEGWWALAWIDVYDLNRDPRYLTMASSIFTDMTGGWDNTCSGGIWWSKDRKYKNAIANELFLSVAGHLAIRSTNRHERKKYHSWAVREWQWFSHSGMINADHLVNDGLDAKCSNNGRTTWTYNQGVVLGGLAELSRTSHDHTFLSTAKNIADAALASPKLVDADDILHDSCEPKCGDDAPQFKGIFVRNLRLLQEVQPFPQYEKFVTSNTDSIWKGAHAPDYRLGLMWSAPYGTADANASTQSSALDALTTALLLHD